ncbi:MAG: AAA family ATPase [Candidatus Cloacimonetes bacterium]|nr:AAA family ATPase [Candidatus Cloacimonadota bacterium]
MSRINYPFSAIVGQEELILGCLICIVNRSIDGILIKGVKGSGKSTVVYSLEDILPEIDINNNCNFNCNPTHRENWCTECKNRFSNQDAEFSSHKVKPVVIPLTTSEEMLVGSIDVEKLLKSGEKSFVPGILAKAHRKVLYIDEVNLLPDFLTDSILDVDATGYNTVEREGFSITHNSDFILIGTMNPEEGDLRPQILDRFSISVDVQPVKDATLRKEIINRNILFKKDKIAFRKHFESKNKALMNTIELACSKLTDIKMQEMFYDLVVEFCSEKNIDGHRADIAIIETAKTHAAIEQNDMVELRHLVQAAKFVLGHRTRKGGLEKPLSRAEITQWFAVREKKIKSVSSEVYSASISEDISISEGELILPPKKY